MALFFDNIHLRPAGRKRLVKSLREMLDNGKLSANKLLMVSHNPHLTLLAPLGSDRAQLLAALDNLDGQVAQGPAQDRRRGLLMERLYEISQMASGFNGDLCTLLLQDGLREIQSYGREAGNRVAGTLNRLHRVSAALSALPGAKSLIYVGSGLELVPTLDPVHQISEICPQNTTEFQQFSRAVDLTAKFQRLTRNMNRHQVTLYALDAGGLPISSSASVDTADPVWRPSVVNDQIRRANLQNSLSFMASDTGGRAVFDTNDLAPAIFEIQKEAASYYSLAYRPSHSADAGTHMIDVEVKKKGARARHRLSYRDKPVDERMADRLQGALLWGLEQNPLGMEVLTPDASSGSGADADQAQVAVKVPLSSLMFLPREGEHLGRLRLQVAANDGDGRRSAFHQKQFEIRLDSSLGGQASGDHLFVVELELKPGRHQLAVGLRDELGQRTSFLASTIEVPGS